MESGYAEATIRSKLWLLADFGSWVRRSGQAVTDLDERLAEKFLAVRQRQDRMDRGNRETVRQFLNHLRECNVIREVKPPLDESPLAGILTRYEKHLRSERGLAAATVINYLAFARKFLVDRFGEGRFPVEEVRSCDISAFVLRHANTMSCGRAQLMTTAFRSFFRFLFQNGELQADLAPCVLAVADWRLSTVPKYLTPDEIGRMLGGCDRQTSTGRRDYVVLLLLARLGLRAGEILIRGKGLLHDRMPLAVDVGKALASYLRVDRPTCRTRRVFVCMKAPRTGFAGPSTVTTIVRRALDRAGLHLAFKGAHVLRHSLATSMLRSGASMGEIGEVLRHRIPSTTEIYAKVDFDGLRSLAHPWPKVGGAR